MSDTPSIRAVKGIFDAQYAGDFETPFGEYPTCAARICGDRLYENTAGHRRGPQGRDTSI